MSTSLSDINHENNFPNPTKEPEPMIASSPVDTKQIEIPIATAVTTPFKQQIKTPPNPRTITLENSRPSTLTILIQTRIANRQNINYYPSMSVPKTSKKKVLFNPLVELHKNIVVDVPQYLPPDYLYTQFFDEASFSTLLNRTLHSYDQPQNRTLEQAKNEGIISKNIDITLSTLFKNNSLFYIDKTPYTVFGYEWVGKDWSIDLNFETKNQFYKNKAQKESVQKELESIFPINVRNSTLAARVSNDVYKYQNEQHIALEPISIGFVNTEQQVPLIRDKAAAAVKSEIDAKALEDAKALADTKTRQRAEAAVSATALGEARMEAREAEIEARKEEEANAKLVTTNLANKTKKYDRQQAVQDILNAKTKTERRQVKIRNLASKLIPKGPYSYENIVVNLKPLNQLLELDENDILNNAQYIKKQQQAYISNRPDIKSANLKTEYLKLKQNYNDVPLENISNFLITNIFGDISLDDDTIVNNIQKLPDIEINIFLILLNFLWFHYYEFIEINKIYLEIKRKINKTMMQLSVESQNSEFDIDIFECINLINYIFKLNTLLCYQYNNLINSFDRICFFIKKFCKAFPFTQSVKLKTTNIVIEQKIDDTIRSLTTLECISNKDLHLKQKYEIIQKITESQQYNNLDLNIANFIFFLKSTLFLDPINYPIPENFVKLENSKKHDVIAILSEESNWFKTEDGAVTLEYYNYMQIEKEDLTAETYEEALNNLYLNEYKKQFSIQSSSQSGGEPTEEEKQKQQEEFNKLLANAFKRDKYGTTNFKKTLKQQNQQYRQQYIQQTDKWSYYVRVELELYPGESVPLEDYSSLICQFRYEKIRKIWAELFGTQYAPGIFTKPSDYKPKNTTAKNNTDKKTEQRPVTTSRIA